MSPSVEPISGSNWNFEVKGLLLIPGVDFRDSLVSISQPAVRLFTYFTSAAKTGLIYRRKV